MDPSIIPGSQQKSKAVRLRNSFSRMWSYWYWFVASVAVGVAIALIYNLYTPPRFTTSMSMLITESKPQLTGWESLSGYKPLLLKDDHGIANHMGMLRSFQMNYEAVANLGRHVSWYKNMPFGDHDIDGEQPYLVEFDDTVANLTNVPLMVIPLDNGKFLIKVDSKAKIGGKTVKVKFEEEGEVNQPFCNSFFSFTLKLHRPYTGKGCYFVFNDTERLARDYTDRLKVARDGKNSDIILLTLSGQKPEKDIAFINELARVYRKHESYKKQRESDSVIRIINRQIADVADTLRAIGGRLSGSPRPVRHQAEALLQSWEHHNSLYAYLLQQKAEAELAVVANAPEAEVIDEARLATIRQTNPRKTDNMLAGILGGLAIPFLIIVTNRYFDNSVRDINDIKALSNIPVWGNIMRSRSRSAIPAIEFPRAAVTESLRLLRASIEYKYGEKESLVVGVHSMIPGEGKSFVALNLAAIMAIANKRVVLVEGDMHQPSIYGHLGIKNNPGLTSWLAFRHPIDMIVLPTRVENMFFIPPGPVVSNTAELLNTKEFGILLDRLKKQYDIIIIDNAPASLVADSIIVRRYSDLDLFVVRHKVTDKKMVEFINMVTDGNKQMKAGIVINDVRPRRYGKYSYRYGREDRLVLYP